MEKPAFQNPKYFLESNKVSDQTIFMKMIASSRAAIMVSFDKKKFLRFQPNSRSMKTTIEGLQEQLIIYVFEPSHMREQEHPTDILSSQDTQRIIQNLPREWRSRTTFKFIPASFLSVMKPQMLDRIANEVFLQVILGLYP